ncbi:MAG: DUF938 domain-containing protein [Sphingomonadales bacterium]
MQSHAKSSPAALRNRDAILEVLRTVLTADATVLEIASGTGEHASYFAQQTNWTWQTSDPDPEARASAAAWSHEEALVPLSLDVTSPTWHSGLDTAYDAIFCANMIHIAPPAATTGLLSGAGQILSDGQRLILYGPFAVGGHHTAQSNAKFDASLKARNNQWGIRDLGVVVEHARQHQLVHQKTVQMPANNLTVIFKKTDKPATALPNQYRESSARHLM